VGDLEHQVPQIGGLHRHHGRVNVEEDPSELRVEAHGGDRSRRDDLALDAVLELLRPVARDGSLEVLRREERGELRGIAKFNCWARVDGKTVAEATILCAMQGAAGK
jgi:hypothetical protein